MNCKFSNNWVYFISIVKSENNPKKEKDKNNIVVVHPATGFPFTKIKIE